MKLPRRLIGVEMRAVCSICGGDVRHLCRRCRETVGTVVMARR